MREQRLLIVKVKGLHPVRFVGKVVVGNNELNIFLVGVNQGADSIVDAPAHRLIVRVDSQVLPRSIKDNKLRQQRVSLGERMPEKREVVSHRHDGFSAASDSQRLETLTVDERKIEPFSSCVAVRFDVVQDEDGLHERGGAAWAAA